MDRKGDAGDLGLDHLLNDDCDGDLGRVEVLLKTVEDGPRGEERGPAVLDIREEGVFRRVEITVELAGPGMLRSVLGGGRGTDRDEGGIEFPEVFFDIISNVLGEGGVFDQ